MTKIEREINQYSEFKAKERFSEVSRQWIFKKPGFISRGKHRRVKHFEEGPV